MVSPDPDRRGWNQAVLFYYDKLGIDTNQRLHKADGLPVEFSDGGQPIRELF